MEVFSNFYSRFLQKHLHQAYLYDRINANLPKEHPIMDQQTVLIGMSGGVDSSVAAWLLQEKGYRCIGGTMLLHDGAADTFDANQVAAKMSIPFHIFDHCAAFRQQVMEHFVQSYEAGLTPNPCTVCNKHLKFGTFLQQALAMGCDFVATGHYARIEKDEATGRYLLKKAADDSKDQTYFLYSLDQHQLSHTLFPLGALTKEQARTIAQEQGFLNARKKDSQDICFIPDGDYPAFLRRFTGKDYPAGDFLDENGRIVGRHSGAVDYTIGQRKGLGLAMGRPVYVCGKDMAANTVTVSDNEALFHTTLLADDWNFIAFDAPTAPLRCTAKARSRMAEQPCTLYPAENGRCRVVFDESQRALTPGQAVVLYDGDTVLGGGIIREVLK